MFSGFDRYGEVVGVMEGVVEGVGGVEEIVEGVGGIEEEEEVEVVDVCVVVVEDDLLIDEIEIERIELLLVIRIDLELVEVNLDEVVNL